VAHFMLDPSEESRSNLKKSDLQTLINPATNTEEEAESEMKQKTGMEE
jgi:hypothetical protein